MVLVPHLKVRMLPEQTVKPGESGSQAQPAAGTGGCLQATHHSCTLTHFTQDIKGNQQAEGNSQHDPPEDDPSSDDFSQLKGSRTSQQPWPNTEPLLSSLPPQDQQSSLQHHGLSALWGPQSSLGWSNLANKSFQISDLGKVFLFPRM